MATLRLPGETLRWWKPLKTILLKIYHDQQKDLVIMENPYSTHSPHFVSSSQFSIVVNIFTEYSNKLTKRHWYFIVKVVNISVKRGIFCARWWKFRRKVIMRCNECNLSAANSFTGELIKLFSAHTAPEMSWIFGFESLRIPNITEYKDSDLKFYSQIQNICHLRLICCFLNTQKQWSLNLRL